MLRNRFPHLRILFFTALVATAAGLCAQPPRGPWARSPQVHADNTVTFEYLAPAARTVLLDGGQFGANDLPMERDSNGIWRITYGPITPDIYPYAFKVDGVTVSDPANVDIFANERFKASLVDVPGSVPLDHAIRDVPHGNVHYVYYPSEILDTTRRMLIYTPPGLQMNGDRQYPVLYLIHGGSDTEETWYKVGRANFIADNLIADGEAEPMLIVMPYGNVRPAPMADFTRDVVDEIVPYIEANYPVVADAEHRAVAGFSVGGGQTLNIGLTHTDVFGYICSYAPYTATEEFRANFTDWDPDAERINDNLKLFTISVGTDDFLYEPVKQNIAQFESEGIELEAHIVDGGHTWMNCKKFLATSLRQLFRDAR